ncbi:hypothetical protein DFH11DRAFT_80832 [Phellopilus nigrolimitatus]|nr:hypothetical protein DFH11DRAFT_80832 [Phellopilus nigrolimitatus]
MQACRTRFGLWIPGSVLLLSPFFAASACFLSHRKTCQTQKQGLEICRMEDHRCPQFILIFTVVDKALRIKGSLLSSRTKDFLRPSGLPELRCDRCSVVVTSGLLHNRRSCFLSRDLGPLIWSYFFMCAGPAPFIMSGSRDLLLLMCTYAWN